MVYAFFICRRSEGNTSTCLSGPADLSVNNSVRRRGEIVRPHGPTEERVEPPDFFVLFLNQMASRKYFWFHIGYFWMEKKTTTAVGYLLLTTLLAFFEFSSLPSVRYYH